MDADVKPEPADDEREAMLAALDPRDDLPAPAEASPWRRAALLEATDTSHP